MLKTFTIEKFDHEQLTETTGLMTFHLADEDGGGKRTVQGSTFLNENQEPQGVSTENIRELPLIENLFSNRFKKTVEVEFDAFNKVYDRETDKTINQVAYDVAMELQEKKSFLKLFSDFFKSRQSAN